MRLENTLKQHTKTDFMFVNGDELSIENKKRQNNKPFTKSKYKPTLLSALAIRPMKISYYQNNCIMKDMLTNVWKPTTHSFIVLYFLAFQIWQ